MSFSNNILIRFRAKKFTNFIGKQSYLFSVLTRIINTFGYREEFLNDERMLKFWIKLTESKSDVNVDTFFERAYFAGCCRRLAKFYIRWAEVSTNF